MEVEDDDQLETQQPGMMMTTMATMMPPPAVAQQQQQQQDHVQFRGTTFSSADEAAALAVQPPELNFNRLRSMSKVFTTLPPVLPTYQQMVADQMEYLCHLMLLETMPDRVLTYKRDYECVLRNFARTTDGPKLLQTPGRLHSRGLLAALAADLFLVREEDEGDGAAVKIVSPASVTADDWNVLREQLILLKGVLLQQNANNAVLMMGGAGGATDAAGADSNHNNNPSIRKPALPDTELEKHEMMKVDYREVLQLLEVQNAMAALREGLQSIEDDDDDDNFASQAAAAASPPRTPTSPRVKRAVEQVVSQYMTNLTNIFPVDTAPADNHKKDDDDDDDDDFGAHEEDEDDLAMDHSLRSVTANIPKELNSFVLTDLYHPKTQVMPAEEGMVDRLLEHVQSITEDTLTPTGTAPGRYSYANLLQKVRACVSCVALVLIFVSVCGNVCFHAAVKVVAHTFWSLSFLVDLRTHAQARALLIKWSESILEIPALVQLGYGGVTSPIVHNDRDDVSSWGGDGEGLDPHHTHPPSEGGSVGGSAANHHHLNRRSRSMMRLLDASRRGRSISVTEEEREIVAQLAKITGATTTHKNAVAAAAAAEEHATEDASTQTLRLRKHSKKKALPAGAVSRLKAPPATARPEEEQEGAKEKEVAPPKVSEKVDEAKKSEAASATKRSRLSATKKAEEAKKGKAAPAAKGGGSKKKEAATKLKATKKAKKPAAAPADIDDSSSDSDSSYERGRNVQRLHRIVLGAAKEKKKPVATAKPAPQPASDSQEYSSEDSPRKQKLERLSGSADRTKAASQQRKQKRATLLDDDSSSSDSDIEAALRRRKTDKDRSDKKRARSSSDASKENVDSPQTKKNGSASKKQKVQRLEWSSDDDEYPEPAPAKRSRRAPGNTQQHRRAFTTDEEDGLRDGVRRFGVGHWKEIQENEPRLRGRDNHQIKDKYRNMQKNGEI